MPSVTVNSEEPIVILKLSEYESLVETLEILSEDSGIVKKIEKARKEMREGKAIPATEFFETLRK